MKRKSPADKLAKKRAALLERASRVLGVGEDETAALLRTERKQSLRLNPLRGDVLTTRKALEALGWEGAPYNWSANCFTNDGPLELIRDSDVVEQGKAFIQNAASWLPVIALDPQPGDTVLDVCAAPGGKTSHIAALTNNQASIWANDNSRTRLAKLQANMRRLGVNVSQYTLYDASSLARKLVGQQFDRILLDAPCSGEGLMQFDRSADFTTWSVAHIKRLQQLQKKIIGQAWQLLRPGGTLVYSTCTMAPEEDESVVDYLVRAHDNAKIVPFSVDVANVIPAVRAWNGKAFAPEIQGCMRLGPSEQIEAFFVCKLQKLADSNEP